MRGQLLAFLSPTTPAEELRREREQVAKKRPHLALASRQDDPRPDPDMYVWKDPSKLWGRS